ncbi:MAG: UDP-N-acetylglucosamine--N-acetylmuramyl-(pentapeptide) pyrophosphoryl-undecaprenol N-acetylglucosamine transferase [Actinobacteria bacterium]|nr:UDP-N-acetylglucosamine--N-acetylmuramyl-(pentapeptide) pyrophosphoryl-undecaprenol N-acetylglucosamine transferase [Actinomycetota bacterium]
MKAEFSRTLVFAGGGTAGHVEPAIAVATEWKSRYPMDREIFIGVEDGLESLLVPQAGFELKPIPRVVAPRSFSFDALSFPLDLWNAVKAARSQIHGADVVVGFGGYVSAPMYVAAWTKRIPIVIHEANAKVGWANILGSLLTSNLACGHAIKRGRFSRARITGIPLRASILSAAKNSALDWRKAREKAKTQLNWRLGSPTVLIMGGSQGSVFINSEIEKALPEFRLRGIQVMHSVGAKNILPASSEGYQPVPYISDMATAYLAADILIARSGAVTCAEFATLGKYALFLPLPIGNGEQARNADFLVGAGRARVVDQKEFTAEWLSSQLDELIASSSRVSDAGLDSDLHAVEDIVVLIEEVIRGKRR